MTNLSGGQGKKPLSPKVFRRRRIAALVILAALIALIWGALGSIPALFGGGAGDGKLAGETCAPGAVVAEAFVGDGTEAQTNFASGVNPKIWFSLTNNGSEDCGFNVGAKVQFFTITSGEEQVWTSRQCDRSGLEDTVINLPAGETLVGPALEWYRVGSTDGGCGPEQKPVLAGGASYHLSVEVNGVVSANDVQFVLD